MSRYSAAVALPSSPRGGATAGRDGRGPEAAPVPRFPAPHRPASHPVLRRARGLGAPSRWADERLDRLEEIVHELYGMDLNEGEMDRYERALEAGHRDNLRRARKAGQV